jgi:hypothetical protein
MKLMSSDGMRVYRAVNQPISARQACSYQRSFLDQYIPNQSFYLTQEQRALLAHLGHTSQEREPAGTYALSIYHRLLIDLSWASSRLEGNRYNPVEAERLITAGLEGEGHSVPDTWMILNHKKAIELMVLRTDSMDFDAHSFLNIHSALSFNLLADPHACGRLRRRLIEIGGTVFVPLSVPALIEEQFVAVLAKAKAIEDPFEQAFFILVQLPYLQPFEDVNKRVSRLGANLSLIKHNLCPLTFYGVPKHAYIDGILGVYELNDVSLLRDVFMYAYERSCRRYLSVTKPWRTPTRVEGQYHQQLIEAVQTIIKEHLPPEPSVFESFKHRGIEPRDHEEFVAMLSRAIQTLHRGHLGSYLLWLSDYEAWAKRYQ